MENPSWLLVMGSVIAVVGIVIIFKQFILQVQEKSEKGEFSPQQELSSFLVKLAMVEAVPIILIGFGMLQILESTGMDILVPLVLIISALLFGWIHVFLTRQQVINDPHTSERVKMLVSNYSMLGIAFVSAFPLISAVLILMTQL